MNCKKCGKELEVISTNLEGFILPCNCTNAAKLIDRALKENHITAFQKAWLDIPSQDNEGYRPDRGSFKAGWNDAFHHYSVLKMARALEIAIEELSLYGRNTHANRALEEINEVCK